jgi:hypothetical protein
MLGQNTVGKVDERPVVLPQGVGRQGLEGVQPLPAEILQQADFFSGCRTLLGKQGFQLGLAVLNPAVQPLERLDLLGLVLEALLQRGQLFDARKGRTVFPAGLEIP